MISIRPTTTWKVFWIYLLIFLTFPIGTFCLQFRICFRVCGLIMLIRLRLKLWLRKYTKNTTLFLTTTSAMVLVSFNFLLIFVEFKIPLFISIVKLSFLLIRSHVQLMIISIQVPTMGTKIMLRLTFIIGFLDSRFQRTFT